MIKNWIIKKLGGVTRDEHEILIAGCESWAIENMKVKNNQAIVPECAFYSPFDGDEIVVVRSNVQVMNGKVKSLSVAPWCRNVIASGLSI